MLVTKAKTLEPTLPFSMMGLPPAEGEISASGSSGKVDLNGKRPGRFGLGPNVIKPDKPESISKDGGYSSHMNLDDTTSEAGVTIVSANQVCLRRAGHFRAPDPCRQATHLTGVGATR